MPSGNASNSCGRLRSSLRARMTAVTSLGFVALVGRARRELLLFPDALLARERGAHEIAIERRRAVRTRLELGMRLRSHEPRVHIERQFDHLDERRLAHDVMSGKAHAVLFEERAVAVVELVPVAVALGDRQI